jgi:predicted transcriptional regulator
VLAILSAIAEQIRFNIVELLREGPLSVNEIVKRLGLQQPQVSKHLQVLSRAGVVEKHASAQSRIYALSADCFADMNEWISSFRDLWDHRLDALDVYLQQLKKRGASTGGQ